MKIITFNNKKFELIGNEIEDGVLDFGWEYINLAENQPRRFGWFSEHSDSKGVLEECWKLADVVRYKKEKEK